MKGGREGVWEGKGGCREKIVSGGLSTLVQPQKKKLGGNGFLSFPAGEGVCFCFKKAARSCISDYFLSISTEIFEKKNQQNLVPLFYEIFAILKKGVVAVHHSQCFS